MSRHQSTRKISRKESGFERHNLLTYLLLSLVFLLLIVPIAESVPFANSLLRVGITAVLVCAAISVERRKRYMMIGVFFAAFLVPTTWATMFISHTTLFAVSCVLESLFFLVMAVAILSSVIRKHLATVHSIYGAISAYLLLGLAWAFLYWGLDRIDDQAMRISARNTSTTGSRLSDQEVAAFSQFIYFSFVTMSTLGYGDITPQIPLAQTLTWMQSVIGQFYIAVLVAWMVSEIPKRPPDTST